MSNATIQELPVDSDLVAIKAFFLFVLKFIIPPVLGIIIGSAIGWEMARQITTEQFKQLLLTRNAVLLTVDGEQKIVLANEDFVFSNRPGPGPPPTNPASRPPTNPPPGPLPPVGPVPLVTPPATTLATPRPVVPPAPQPILPRVPDPMPPPDPDPVMPSTL